jgi:hypothetical protein
MLAHAPLQLLVAPLSFSKRYRVRPLASTRTRPSLVSRVLTVPVAVLGAGLALPYADPPPAVPDDEPPRRVYPPDLGVLVRPRRPGPCLRVAWCPGIRRCRRPLRRLASGRERVADECPIASDTSPPASSGRRRSSASSRGSEAERGVALCGTKRGPRRPESAPLVHSADGSSGALRAFRDAPGSDSLTAVVTLHLAHSRGDAAPGSPGSSPRRSSRSAHLLWTSPRPLGAGAR